MGKSHRGQCMILFICGIWDFQTYRSRRKNLIFFFRYWEQGVMRIFCLASINCGSWRWLHSKHLLKSVVSIETNIVILNCKYARVSAIFYKKVKQNLHEKIGLPTLGLLLSTKKQERLCVITIYSSFEALKTPTFLYNHRTMYIV